MYLVLAFNAKFSAQNAKTYKSECASFAGRLQTIGDKVKEFIDAIEKENREIIGLKWDLKGIVNGLESVKAIIMDVRMFLQQRQLPVFPNAVPNAAENFRLQRLITDLNRRLDNAIGSISVAFSPVKIQKELSIEEQEEFLKKLKDDVERELKVLEEKRKEYGNKDQASRWLEIAIEQQHLRFIDYKQIIIDKFLMKGGFGIIHLAYWDDTPVVLKQLFDQKDFIDEIRLHKLVHDGDYIVKFHGITKDTDGNLGMIMKYAANGNLREYLKVHGMSLSWYQRVLLAKQIAIGLSFIHREKIYHRDFHSGNILIDENGGPMITDFGLSRVSDRDKRASIDEKTFGLVAYTAPERLKNSKYPFDERCDIYSLGVIFWEISACCKPFHCQNDSNLAVKILLNERETFSSDTPEKYVELVNSCWHYDPSKRSTMAIIKQTLNEILKSLAKENVKNITEHVINKFEKNISSSSNSNLNTNYYTASFDDNQLVNKHETEEIDASLYLSALEEVDL
ncbi:kinase-like domain-containing protein [Gigaspora rosea]|uniref:Kinase-like domain-containing protein n=1 Tax=Gigaspora rosea TaxID=44941 RepID=A0A397TRD4_9GLOM|nr:kinase-like domain-containing protein [Gigaspora rosea]